MPMAGYHKPRGKYIVTGVITCNTDTFYGVGTNPVIAVFIANEPHPTDKVCKFIDFRDDGYEVRAHIGLVEGDSAKDKRKHLLDVWNGVSQFVSEDNYEYGSDAAGCISVGLDTQTAFYQPHRFITGQNIHIVKSNRLNKDFALFYTTILKKQMEAKFNWGGNGATLGRMKSIEALAPINQDGTQDYEYMTEYSKEKQKELLSRYKRFSEKETSKIESKKIPVLEEKEWKDYSVTSLFNTIIAGKGKGLNHLHKTTKNGISYIGATNRNNGVLCFVSEDESSQKMVLPGNCIGFIKNGDGSAGFAIYKAESFVSTSDVIYGYADWINKYTGLFFVAAQDMIERKYSHGYKRNRQHLNGNRVMLPANRDGNPDFKYMEQYAKNMMLKKYKQYLSFLERKEKKQ